jgi:hypothetical protein
MNPSGPTGRSRSSEKPNQLALEFGVYLAVHFLLFSSLPLLKTKSPRQVHWLRAFASLR